MNLGRLGNPRTPLDRSLDRDPGGLMLPAVDPNSPTVDLNAPTVFIKIETSTRYHACILYVCIQQSLYSLSRLPDIYSDNCTAFTCVIFPRDIT